MKKIATLIIFTFMFMLPIRTYASETEIHSFIAIKATVPQDFDEDIALAFIEKESGATLQSYLTKANKYEGLVSILKDKEYTLDTYFNGMSDYTTSLPETIIETEITGEMEFSVSKIQYSIEESSNIDAIETTVSVYNDDILDIGIDSAENVIKQYNETVYIMNDNASYKDLLALYSGPMFEKHYYKADPMNTKEDWDNMSEVEKFSYYITYYMPYTKMMNYTYNSEEEYIGELDTVHTLLAQAADGEKVYQALCEVWRWHYKYWQRTGIFYNFYSRLDGVNEMEEREVITEVLTKEDKEELNEIKEEIENSGIEVKTDNVNAEEAPQIKENPILEFVKSNIITLLVLVVAGVAFAVIKRRNKKDDEL